MNKNQNKDNSFEAFALICLIITIISLSVNELITWLSK